MGSISTWHWVVVLGLIGGIVALARSLTRDGTVRLPAGSNGELVGITRWTIRVLFALMGITIVAVASGAFERQLLLDIAAGTFSTQQAMSTAAAASDARQRAVGIAQIIAYIITLIVVGRWIYQANVGARRLGALGMEFTPGWSVGWYFVPFANLWKPYQAMREIWRASATPSHWRATAVPSRLGWWWTCWISSNVLGQASFRMSQAIHGIDDALATNAVGILSDVIEVPLCLLLISIVREIYANQMTATPVQIANASQS